MAMDQPTIGDDDTFYVDVIDVNICVDAVTSEQDEGFVALHINSKPTEMKIDTGAKCSVMPLETFNDVNNGEQLVKHKRTANLVAHGGTKIKTCGKTTIKCVLMERCHCLST